MKGLGEDPRLAAHVGAVHRHGREAGDEHDAKLGEELGCAPRKLDAVELWHHDIGEEEVIIVAPDEIERRLAVPYRLDGITRARERPREEAAHVIVVLGEEDAGHGLFHITDAPHVTVEPAFP